MDGKGKGKGNLFVAIAIGGAWESLGLAHACHLMQQPLTQ